MLRYIAVYISKIEVITSIKIPVHVHVACASLVIHLLISLDNLRADVYVS